MRGYTACVVPIGSTRIPAVTNDEVHIHTDVISDRIKQ